MTAMRLSLFAATGERLGSREMTEGELVIGRGADVDWRVDDPDRYLSRRHCVLHRSGDHVDVTDISTNGVFLANRRVSGLPEHRAPLEPGQSVTLGGFRLVLERDAVNAAGAPVDRRKAAN